MEGKKLEVGTDLEVQIGTVGSKGDGIAKVNNNVVFVPGTKEGDLVKVKITKVINNVAFGEKEGGSPQVEEEVTNPDEILSEEE